MLCASCTVVYTVSYGLTRSLTVLYDRLYDYTRTSHPCQFFKSFKNHTRLTRIHSNGPSVSRIRPRFIRLYVRFTRVTNRVNRVFCVRRALKIENFQLNIFDIFLIFAQNINCGYTLEPPRRDGSNEYPQSMF